MFAGAPAEERTLPQLRAAGVPLAILGDVGGTRARGVQAGDHAAVLTQHLAVHIRRQTSDGETGVHRLAEREIENGPGAFVLWCKEVWLFVELGVLTLGCVGVVAVQCGDQIARRNAERGLHLCDRLEAVDELDQRERRPFEMFLVDDEERRVVGLVHDESRCAGVVGVLGDEPLSEIVDDDPGEQDRRRVDRGGDERLVHVLGGTTGRHAQSDAETVVVGVAEYERLLGQFGGVLGDHLGVHHETARGDHHRFGPNRAGVGEVLPRHTDHLAVVVDHQVRGTGLVADLHAEFVGPLEQQIDHHRCALGIAGHRHLVSARRGCGDVLERPDLLVAGVHQPLGVGLDHRFVGVVAALERDAEVFEPIEVLDAALAVSADLVVFGFAGHRDEVLVHLLGAVVVPGGFLHGGAAAQIEVAAGQRCGASGDRGAFKHEYARPRGGSADGRTAAPDAESHHHYIGVVRPFGDAGSVDCRGSIQAAHGLRISRR